MNKHTQLSIARAIGASKFHPDAVPSRVSNECRDWLGMSNKSLVLSGGAVEARCAFMHVASLYSKGDKSIDLVDPFMLLDGGYHIDYSMVAVYDLHLLQHVDFIKLFSIIKGRHISQARTCLLVNANTDRTHDLDRYFVDKKVSSYFYEYITSSGLFHTIRVGQL